MNGFLHGLIRHWRELLLVSFPALTLSAFATNSETLPKGTLSGTIVDAAGKPLKDAKVSVGTWDEKAKTLAEARSDAAGRFCLGPLEPLYRHRFPMVIEAEGFATQYIRGASYSIFPGVDYDLGRIRLDRGRVFMGQVLDVDGSPRPKVEIKYCVLRYSLGHTVDYIGSKSSITTDSEGRYRTPPLPVGELWVTTSPPNRERIGINRRIEPGGEETLEPLRLKPDVPIEGRIIDAQGKPVVGAELRWGGEQTATSDAEGKFILHGFGPLPQHFQLQSDNKGSVFINWSVFVRKDGIYWIEVHDESEKEHGPLKELLVKLTPQAWIEGLAVDAETGQPVHIKSVTLCNFERKANGEIVLSGCRSPRFEQPEDGRFRVPYSTPMEYHLALTAEGYQDAEAFTPKVAQLQTIGGIVVKFHKLKAGDAPEPAKQTISGIVTRDGKPVQDGWVGLWKLRRKFNAVNAWMLRGRTAEGEPVVYESAVIKDGKYSLKVPYQDDAWYVVAEEPGHALTQVGPTKIALGEKKTCDIACTEGGTIRGRVNNVPDAWKGHFWAVAFTKTGIQMEARVGDDGTFVFPQMPPGDYGLKVGHDSYKDAEVPELPKIWTGSDAEKEIYKRQYDPWQRAKVVAVESGRESTVELEPPP